MDNQITFHKYLATDGKYRIIFFMDNCTGYVKDITDDCILFKEYNYSSQSISEECEKTQLKEI
ncbi:MAG: hypothetical protein WDA59_08200 [Methanofastidiosum sp.]